MPSAPQRILYYYGSHHIDTGSPKVLLSMVELLDRRTFQPYFLGTGQGPLIEALRERNVEIVPGQVFSLTPRRPLRLWKATQAKRRLLRSWRIDLVHVNEFGWNYDLVLAAALERIPVVLHLHNPATIQWQNLHRLAATRVLTVSRAQVATIDGFHRIRRRHQVLYNTVDVARFQAGTPIRDTLGLEPTDFLVATVAQISHRKGLDIVIEVARRLVPRHARLHFLLIGPRGVGEEAYLQSVRDAAEAPELRGKVHLLGSRQDVPDLLASSDVFLFPTRAEPFGIAVVEAMAAGLPVVASAIGGVPEILDSEEIGTLVPGGDADQFAGCVEALLQDPARARAIGRQAAVSVAERFGAEAIGQELNALYRSMLTS